LGQFQQHFTLAFFDEIFSPKKSLSQIVIREKMHNLLLHKKRVRKMLMKLTPVEIPQDVAIINDKNLPRSSLPCLQAES